MMAKRILVLQYGHHGGFHLVSEKQMTEQKEVYQSMSRVALMVAEAFYDELDAFGSVNPTTGHGEP
jgi:hypothetical protein